MTMFASLSCSVCHYLAENCNQRFAAKLRQLRDVPFFIPPPSLPTCSSKNDCNPNPQIFVGILWKVKPEVFALCRQLLRKKSTPPPHNCKPVILRGRGADNNWNVPAYTISLHTTVAKGIQLKKRMVTNVCILQT